MYKNNRYYHWSPVELHAMFYMASSVDWCGKEMKNKQTKRQTNGHKMLGISSLGSQMERLQLPEAQHVYYIELHREVRLLHVTEQ